MTMKQETKLDLMKNIDKSQGNQAVLEMNTSKKSSSIPSSSECTSQPFSPPLSLPKITLERKSKATQTDPPIQNCQQTNTEEKRINEKEELCDEIVTLALTWLHI